MNTPTPTLLGILALTVRPGDCIWQDNGTFMPVLATNTDPCGLIRVEFGDHTAAWYSKGDYVHVAVNPAVADSWNTHFGTP